MNDTEILRNSFYKTTASFIRAYSDIAQDLNEAGYSDKDIDNLQKEIAFYNDVRLAVKIILMKN